jgi:4-hydroxy-tetrahydrodipicolinate reductase
MGIETCRAVAAADDLELVAAIHPSRAGQRLDEVAGVDSDLVVSADLSAALTAGADILVDFSVAGAAVTALEFCLATGIHAVSGTTGIDEATFDRLGNAFSAPGAPNAVIAANFSISAVILHRLAELCAPHFPVVEIVELHHPNKHDAPSGTALETARRLAAAREAAGLGPFVEAVAADEVVPGVRGGVGPGGIRLHAVRLQALMAHEEVLFGAPGQSLTLRQDTADRTAYMPGVLLALRLVAETNGLTRGIDALLGVG